MALYAYTISPWFEQRFLLADGSPNAGGFVYTYQAGGYSILQTTWQDAQGNAQHTNPIELDAYGRPPSPIFVSGTGYNFLVQDANGVQLYAVPLAEDSGRVFATTWGNLLGTPTTYSDTDVIPATERYAQIDSSAGATTIYLSAAADMTQPLTIKNMNGNTVTVTPDGTDTLENALTSYVIPAASSPTFPSIVLASDQVSNVSILASHGI